MLAKHRDNIPDEIDTKEIYGLINKLIKPKVTESTGIDGFHLFEDETPKIDVSNEEKKLDPSNMNDSGQKQNGSSNSVSDSIRVDVRRVDGMLDLLGELVVNQSYIHQILKERVTDIELERTLRKAMKITGELRDATMSLRLIPIKGLFNKQRRVVRDAAHNLGKKIHFEFYGEWVEIDKVIADQLNNPLTHILRNCVDHGIEKNVEDRIACGKPQTGTIILKAEHKDDHIIITIQDDGGGIDIDTIYEKARKKGLTNQDRDSLTSQEILDFIFAPGFTTREQVSEYSGRGVGMNVVRETIASLTGSISIESEKNLGTRFTMVLPLSLSVVSGLVAEAAGEKFIVPISQLVSTLKIHAEDIQGSVGEGRMIKVRDHFVGIVSVSQVFDLPGACDTQGDSGSYGVLVNDGTSSIVLEFDRIDSQQSFIMKPLTSELLDVPGLKAGAVLGDGEPALVLNLFQMHSYWSHKIGN